MKLYTMKKTKRNRYQYHPYSKWDLNYMLLNKQVPLRTRTRHMWEMKGWLGKYHIVDELFFNYVTKLKN